MTLLRKDVDYAIRALIYLALRGRSDYVSATALARELGLPASFLRRICSTLIKADMLETREGIAGGVRLLGKPDTINILKLIELFHGKPELSECTFRKKLCPNRKTCVLRRRLLRIEQTVVDEFKAVTIQMLLDDLQSASSVIEPEPKPSGKPDVRDAGFDSLARPVIPTHEEKP